MAKKSRLPLYEILLERGLAEDERQACSLIMQGRVYVDGVQVCGAKARIPVDAEVEVALEKCPYVSRAGLKLENLLRAYPVLADSIRGATCLDIGAGTGGFTEVLLEFGAERVYAVDVGRGILHPKLRKDPRVIVLEGVNAKDLSPRLIPPIITLFTLDVSFISGVPLLAKAKPLLATKREPYPLDGVYLIKPQFERKRDQLDERRGEFKDGVVRSKSLMLRTLRKVYQSIRSTGFLPTKVALAEPRGSKGNYEFLAILKRAGESLVSSCEALASATSQSVGELQPELPPAGGGLKLRNGESFGLSEEEFMRESEQIIEGLPLS